MLDNYSLMYIYSLVKQSLTYFFIIGAKLDLIFNLVYSVSDLNSHLELPVLFLPPMCRSGRELGGHPGQQDFDLPALLECSRAAAQQDEPTLAQSLCHFLLLRYANTSWQACTWMTVGFTKILQFDVYCLNLRPDRLKYIHSAFVHNTFLWNWNFIF